MNDRTCKGITSTSCIPHDDIGVPWKVHDSWLLIFHPRHQEDSLIPESDGSLHDENRKFHNGMARDLSKYGGDLHVGFLGIHSVQDHSGKIPNRHETRF